MEAEEILQWETQVVPGLLQTEAYASAVEQWSHSIEVIPPSRVDARVETRLARQSVLKRETPLRLSLVLDESSVQTRGLVPLRPTTSGAGAKLFLIFQPTGAEQPEAAAQARKSNRLAGLAAR
ncbi:DUF5753 domain-containing protein [Actinoallomurus sp. WRP9H-5]|nr:DUF5753 domain-containing protein [Actinoallomurus rhizosphaericola]